MADLSPNVGVLQPHGGVGGMDLPSLMHLVQQSRELQTQQAVSDQLRASGGDAAVATRQMLQPGAPGMMSPQLLGHMQELQQKYFNVMADTATSVLGYGRPITDEVVNGMGVTMAGQGVPDSVIRNFLHTMPPETDQKGRQLAISQIENLRKGGATPDLIYRPTGTGGEMEPQLGAATRASMQAPPPAEQQAPVPGGPKPGTATTLAKGEEGSLEASAANAVKLQGRAPEIAAQRSVLTQIADLADKAKTGGDVSDVRLRINQTLEGLGLNGIDSKEELTATELFKKFTSQLQQQQAHGWTTEANLASVYSGNPSTQLSKLGNKGVAAWLLGGLDTENLVMSQWNKWKAANGGGEHLNNMFHAWLNDTLKPGFGRGFNSDESQAPGSGGIRNFDPRVLQFQRLDPDGQRAFVKDMKDKDKFAANLNRYKRFNYLAEAQQ